MVVHNRTIMEKEKKDKKNKERVRGEGSICCGWTAPSVPKSISLEELDQTDEI